MPCTSCLSRPVYVLLELKAVALRDELRPPIRCARVQVFHHVPVQECLSRVVLDHVGLVGCSYRGQKSPLGGLQDRRIQVSRVVLHPFELLISHSTQSGLAL